MLIFLEINSASVKEWTDLSQSQKSHSTFPVNAIKTRSWPDKRANEENAFLTTLY